jgi:hypothetical protein
MLGKEPSHYVNIQKCNKYLCICEIQTCIRPKLYNYEYLYFCLHKYLLSYLFFIYDYYATTSFLLWILHIRKLCQNLWKLIFQLFSQVYFIKLCTFTTSYSYQVKVFPKVPNTHLYTKQKETKQKFPIILHKICTPCDLACTLIYTKIFLVSHHFFVMHMGPSWLGYLEKMFN